MKALSDLESKFLRHAGHFEESSGTFPFGNCIITYTLSKKHSEVEVYNPDKDRYLDNIAIYLSELEREIYEDADIWDCHGFSSSSDYINYKY